MPQYAKALETAIAVVMSGPLPDGELVVIVNCRDYEDYRALPAGIEYDGREYGLTGWNSDFGTACYKASHKFARAK